jgi:hypothetical protein
MQEDVLGTRKTIVGDRYEVCTRCGQPITVTDVAAPHLAGEGPSLLPTVPGAARPLETTQDAPPPLLCPACAREVAAGEPVDLPDQEADAPEPHVAP